MIVGGITGQDRHRRPHLSEAKDTIAGWLEDLGVDPSKAGRGKAQASLDDHRQRLGAAATASRRAQRALVARLLPRDDRPQPLLPAQGRPDDPRLGRAAHAASRRRSRSTITQRVIGSLRGYFLGVTIVAAFNAVVVAIGAWILGVPMIGTIAAVTFLGAYIPYIGAWAAGAFAVLIALGGAGTDAAIGMIVVAAARQQRPPAARPAAGDGRRARHPPARRPGRDDRRRGAVRHGRADPRRAADLGGRPDLGRPGHARAEGRSRKPRARIRRAEPAPDDPAAACLSGLGAGDGGGLARSRDQGAAGRRGRPGAHRDALLLALRRLVVARRPLLLRS